MTAEPRTLTRRELTAALAARQMLLKRERLDPAEAIRRLTPLQGQEPQAPFVSLAARLEGFSRPQLEAAIDARAVAKTTIMRQTLHLVATSEYLAYAQLLRTARLRTWARAFPDLDPKRVVRELSRWLSRPRTNEEIRARVTRYEGVPDNLWTSIMIARTLLPLVQLPPAGHWKARRPIEFELDRRPLPEPADAAALVLTRYLDAFGPASRRDVSSWAGVAQVDLAPAFERVRTVSYRDERGVELLDLPDRPLPPASTKLPVRFLPRWEQSLLAYADRERIMPPELGPLRITLSGDQTVTVDGRVAATWKLERSARAVRVAIVPHREIRRSALASIRAEAKRTARFCEPEAAAIEVAGLAAH